MKTIGLLGGMSWESTATYYKIINEGVKNILGGLHSAKIVMISLDFEEISTLQSQGKWDETIHILSDAAHKLEVSGADFIMICTNTMHKLVPDIEKNISIPVLHIADTTAERLLMNKVSKVGLLGTKFTMEQDFYKARLLENFGIEVVVPNIDQRQKVHNIIYSELCLGSITDESRQEYLNVIDDLHKRGAQAIILGCTEIPLLVQQQHTSVPLYDTTQLHATKAVKIATE